MIERGKESLSVEFNRTRISVINGDITQQEVDAIVNAAKHNLGGGSGVDGAIHEAAGAEQLAEACAKLGGCETGEAKITPGFNLRARFIIHAVGPFFASGPVNEAGKVHNERAKKHLTNCYVRSLELASKNGIRTIAFPAISAGAWEYPVDRASDVAMEAVKAFLEENPELFDEVRFVMFGEDDFAVGRRKLTEHFE